MKLRFFDANVYVGQPSLAVHRPAATGEALLAALDQAGIDRALVWHVAQHNASPPEGNDLLAEAIRGRERLVGAWTLLPPHTDEVPVKGLFKRMKSAGVRAVRLFPDVHRYLMRRAVWGKLLGELADRRVPLVWSVERSGWDGAYALLEMCPELTCILCDTGVWNQDRYAWPLLAEYPRVVLESSLISLQAGGVEETVRRFGAERLVFGSGFPVRYFEAAMLQLIHARIADPDKQRIADGNLSALLKEARL